MAMMALRQLPRVAGSTWRTRKNLRNHWSVWPIRSRARRISGWNTTTRVSRPTCSSESMIQVTVRMLEVVAIT